MLADCTGKAQFEMMRLPRFRSDAWSFDNMGLSFDCTAHTIRSPFKLPCMDPEIARPVTQILTQ